MFKEYILNIYPTIDLNLVYTENRTAGVLQYNGKQASLAYIIYSFLFYFS